ncbi:MAG: YkgJ family cysteine cluster protein [Candidatus Latescibacteria bacterium]|nr:YkgJ family cysteine cluster protein [Candidatus Latescibacterota bacterium]
MSDSLMQITPPVGQQEPMLPDAVRERLNALYDEVPGVSCSACDRPGSCCELTQTEFDDDYATMYPLYAVEYLNVVDYVRTHFDSERQREFLSLSDERPMKCPFLTDTGGCSIHPARPLTCRTYGVLNEVEQVDAVAEAHKADMPPFWISAFLSTERYTVCAQTQLQEPEKLQTHLKAMASFDYERRMIALAEDVGVLDKERQQVFESITKKEVPTRWTLGGFNVLLLTPISWLKDNFSSFWKKSFLGE